MLIGYAWVSTDDQNLDLQRDALRLAGCEKMCEDRMSGVKAARPGLTMAADLHGVSVATVYRALREQFRPARCTGVTGAGREGAGT